MLDPKNLSRAFTSRFEFIRLLGEGGMGCVHLARDAELARLVAIKFLMHLEGGEDGDDAKRFREEARVCGSLKHAAIVRLFSWGFESSLPYLVFEYVEGRTLQQEIATTGPLTAVRTLEIAEALLGGLQEAHALEIVHRDLKPANVLLRAGDGQPMLADFGVAKSLSRKEFTTAAHLILGTPAYMAPEIILGQPVTPRVDLYGLGCLLHECLTGQPPFLGRTDLDTLEMHLHEPAPLLDAGNDPPGTDLASAIERALAKDPCARFASAREMASRLAARSGRTPTAPASGESSPVTSRKEPPLADSGTVMVSRTTRARRDATIVTSLDSTAGRPVVRLRPSARAPDEPGRGRWLRRTGLVAIPALALLALVLRSRQPDVSEARALVEQGGALTVSWETPQPSRGTVLLRELNEPRPDRPDPREALESVRAGPAARHPEEPGERRSHTVVIRGLPASRPHVVAILAGSGRIAWCRAFSTPSTRRATRASTRAGSPDLVLAPVEGPCVGELIVGGRRVRSSTVRDGQLVFELPADASCMPEPFAVELRPAPGIAVSLPVETPRELATRLASQLRPFKPAEIVMELVKLREFDNWLDFPKILGQIDPDRLLRSHPRATGTFVRNPFARFIEAALQRRGLWSNLEQFRSQADPYFACPDIPDTEKIGLYEGLLGLRYVDMISASQHDGPVVRVRELHRRLVEDTYSLTATAPGKASEPPEVPVFAGLTSWYTADYDDWPGMFYWTTNNPMFRLLNPGVDPSSRESLRRTFASRRVTSMGPVRGAGGPGTAELRTVVTLLGPSYGCEVALVPDGEARPFKLLLTQAGTPDWLVAMDETPVPSAAAMADPHQAIGWGEIRTSFPARFVPAGTFRVAVTYHHVPGPKLRQISSIQRVMFLREMTLRVMPGR